MSNNEKLEQHLKIIEHTLEVLKEENRLLREEGEMPSAEFLEKKRELLPKLDDSIKQVKASAQSTDGPLGIGGRQIVQKAKQLLLKIFYIDRENEQLLLKRAITPVCENRSVAVDAKTLENFYSSK